MQETFFHLARLSGRARESINIAYATRAIRNECYSALRRRRHARAAQASLIEPALPAVGEEERLIVEQALYALPSEQREVVYLKVNAWSRQ